METTNTGICGKCGGSGRLAAFSHIDNGRCFACHGTGAATVRPTRRIRPAPRMDAATAERQAQTIVANIADEGANDDDRAYFPSRMAGLLAAMSPERAAACRTFCNKNGLSWLVRP